MKKLLPLFMLLAACGPGEAPKQESHDRIVSIVPSVTELLFCVGAGDQVVGVTRYCTHPPEAKKKEIIGDLTLDYEKVLSLKPDVIFSSRSLARKSNLALERLGLRVVTVDAESFEEIARELRRIGKLTGHAEAGERAATDLERRVRAVEEHVRGKSQPSVYLETTPDPIGTAGPDSYAGDAIARAGGRNVMDDLGRPWSPVSWELVLKKDPDIILVAHDQTEAMSARPGWTGLRAVRAGRVHVVPENELVYAAPRLVLGLERLARLFHEAD